MTSQQWRRRDVPAVEPLREVLVRQGDGDGAAEEDVRVAHEGVSHDVQDERVELGGREWRVWFDWSTYSLLKGLTPYCTTVRIYRVTRLLGNNLPLTWFWHFRQLLGRYCSYLLPRQDGGTFQIQVNGRFLPRRRVTLYRVTKNDWV